MTPRSSPTRFRQRSFDPVMAVALLAGRPANLHLLIRRKTGDRPKGTQREGNRSSIDSTIAVNRSASLPEPRQGVIRLIQGALQGRAADQGAVAAGVAEIGGNGAQLGAGVGKCSECGMGDRQTPTTRELIREACYLHSDEEDARW